MDPTAEPKTRRKAKQVATVLQQAVRKAITHVDSVNAQFIRAHQRRVAASAELRAAQDDLKRATGLKYAAQYSAFRCLADEMASSLNWDGCVNVYVDLFSPIWGLPIQRDYVTIAEETAERAFRRLADKFVAKKMVNVDQRAVSCGKALAFCIPHVIYPDTPNKNIMDTEEVRTAGMCLVSRRGVLLHHLTEIMRFADPLFASLRHLPATTADRAICRCAVLPNKCWVGHSNKMSVAVRQAKCLHPCRTATCPSGTPCCGRPC